MEHLVLHLVDGSVVEAPVEIIMVSILILEKVVLGMVLPKNQVVHMLVVEEQILVLQLQHLLDLMVLAVAVVALHIMVLMEEMVVMVFAL
tara:strand:- start:929 stop:1198 length:270 start_codon:yes stop_codon:yes gene_type:complete